eukprot:7221285-Prymnesium_polylepis.1
MANASGHCGHSSLLRQRLRAGRSRCLEICDGTVRQRNRWRRKSFLVLELDEGLRVSELEEPT